MKKLVMAVAIVCAAVCAQAAAVSWSATSLVDIKGVSLKTTEQFASYTVTATFWDSDGTTELKTMSGTWDKTLGSVKGTWDGTSTTHTYWGQIVITDKDGNTLTSEKAQFTTDSAATYKPNFGTGKGFDTVSSKFDQTGTTYGWVAVPEPTSAMLLLIGMAGLALKRKRA